MHYKVIRTNSCITARSNGNYIVKSPQYIVRKLAKDAVHTIPSSMLAA